MEVKRVFGIDLGTTYSCIAYVDGYGQATIINNSENESTTPSVVFFESENNIVVGSAAKEVASLYTDRVVSAVKRGMGKPDVKFEFFGKEYTPQEISAFILGKLAKDAEANVGEKIEDVIITCPAYFGVNQKEATKQAGIIAGLNPLYIIPEPTAAAMLYGFQNPGQSNLSDETVLVYDLGGGTFDITLINVEGTNIKVISTGGDDQLGGKDWDDSIVEYMANCFETETSIPADELLNEPEIYQELLILAESCKIALSSLMSWKKKINAKGQSVLIELSREKLDEITSQHLERTITLTKEMVDRSASFGYPNISKLLLVGGSSYMPQVTNRLKEEFPFEIRLFEPNLAVAKGAAIYGHKCYIDKVVFNIISEDTGKKDIEDVTEDERKKAEQKASQILGLPPIAVEKVSEMAEPINVASKSIGLVVVDENGNEVVDNLVIKDNPVPCKGSKKYGTYQDGQTSISFRLMENERRTEENETVSLGDCTETDNKADMIFDRPMPKNSPIEVIFELAKDGLLTVDGEDLTTHKKIRIEVNASGILTAEELEIAKSNAMSKSIS